MLLSIVIFVAALVLLWKAAELTIKGIEKLSRSTKVSSFAASFLILGILTSISEISVGVNALLDNTPEVFVGNLIGGSFVLLLLIIPILAIFNKGVVLKNHLNKDRLLFFLLLLIAPMLVALDGTVTRANAIFILILYALFVYVFQKNEGVGDRINFEKLNTKLVLVNLTRVVFGAALIFIASRFLVDQTVSIATAIGIPSFLLSLLILSLGTNLPELVITIESIKRRRSDIAFGDYVGSAAANSMLFGVFSLIHGTFSVPTKGFSLIFWIMLIGYVFFFKFGKSKNQISGAEGILLILIYVLFLLTQTTEIILFAN